MISLADSYAYAKRLTRAQATTFYYTFWFLPPERRRSIFAVYAFSRRADDAVDAVEERGTTEAKARSDLAYLRKLLDGSPPDDPLVPALRDTVDRFRIPREPFEELLLGMEMDLVKKSYRTFEELHAYCYRAASVVGLICVEIFGHNGHNGHDAHDRRDAHDAYGGAEVREPAIDLGIAMQLTNILRDVKEDLARGRVYLPEEDMARFAYTANDLRSGIVDDRFRSLMAFEVERARGYFRSAERLFPCVLPESRYCPVLLQRFYSRILDRIERQGYDVLRRRARLGWGEKVGLAARTWREARREQSRKTAGNPLPFNG